MSKHKKKKSFWNWIKTHKLIVFFLVAIIIMVLIVSGTKIYLYLNLLLGNDLVIKLESDNSDFTLIRGEVENVSFKSSVITNPFCTAKCTSKFVDISNNKTLDNSDFILKKNDPITKNYNITTQKLGSGQLLYRFLLECKSKSTTLCHTNEEITSREVLVTVEYKLSDEENELKNKLKDELLIINGVINNSINKLNVSKALINDIDKRVDTDDLKKILDDYNSILNSEMVDFNKLKEIWDSLDYYLLKEGVDAFDSKVLEINNSINSLNNETLKRVNTYNTVLDQIGDIKKRFEDISNLSFINNKQVLLLNSKVYDFNFLLSFFNNRRNITEKKEMVEVSLNITNEFLDRLNSEIEFDTAKKILEINIDYDLLCLLNQTCVTRPNIINISDQVLNRKSTCNDIFDLRILLNNINGTLDKNLTTDENSTLAYGSLKQKIIDNYILNLPDNNINSLLLKDVLLNISSNITKDYFNSNMTSKVVLEIIKEKPQKCEFVNKNVSKVNDFFLNKIDTDKKMSFEYSVEFNEPVPSCCVFENCKPCCVSDDCINDLATFPVVLLHGHAFNKNTEYEYSLDAFNKIQSELEFDGYLNSGAISVYTPKDDKIGVWGLSGVPISIKGSYYFDVFESPDNYVLVQTKSANIDTYAVRLKEIIDNIKLKTNKPKVNIVAHSMGGLVARRYLQIFGSESVNNLIMIGTPNKGIRGNTADYCPITGDKLECLDMNSDSLFLNKLNRGRLPNINIVNIVGTGCQMSDEDGDGVVLKQDATLDGANNFFINGSCSSLNPLHTEMLNVDKYPRVYSIIKESLKE